MLSVVPVSWDFDITDIFWLMLWRASIDTICEAEERAITMLALLRAYCSHLPYKEHMLSTVDRERHKLNIIFATP